MKSYDILQPKFGKLLRLLLYLFFAFVSICLAVVLVISVLNLLKDVPIFSQHPKLTSILILLIPVLLAFILFRVTRKFIDRSSITGTLSIKSNDIVISLHTEVKHVQYNDIKYIRFANSMGWGKSSPDAYQIQIVCTDDSKIDLTFVRAQSNGENLKHCIESQDIETRYWNLSSPYSQT